MSSVKTLQQHVHGDKHQRLYQILKCQRQAWWLDQQLPEDLQCCAYDDGTISCIISSLARESMESWHVLPIVWDGSLADAMGRRRTLSYEQTPRVGSCLYLPRATSRMSRINASTSEEFPRYLCLEPRMSHDSLRGRQGSQFYRWSVS
jgi:hypothetical protein